MNQECLVNGGRRVLSRQPSEGIARIGQLRPEIFLDNGGRVCPAVTRNYVGALLLARDRAQYAAEFQDRGFPVPYEVDKPIHFLEGVPVSVFDRFAGRYRDTGLVAENVMVKEVGIPTGLVVEGELAGLVLRNETGINRRGMYAVRVLNDYGAAEDGYPYSPGCTTPIDTLTKSIVDMMKFSSPRVLEFWKIVEQQKTGYQAAYSDLVEKGYRKKEDLMESDLIFELMRAIGMPVDEKRFHMTTSRVKADKNLEDNQIVEGIDSPNYDEVAIFNDPSFGLVEEEEV